MQELKIGDAVLTDSNIFSAGLPLGTELRVVSINEADGFYKHKGYILDEGLRAVANQDHQWFSVEDVVVKTPQDTPSVKYFLKDATIVSEDGVEFHLKRSKCRHYYIETAGDTQQRVSLGEIKRLVESL